MLTSPLRPDGDINRHINSHGDGVKVIALWVDDASKSYQETTKRGAESYFEPKTIEDENGSVVLSGIHTYGETVHVFVERSNYNGPFMPGFKTWDPHFKADPLDDFIVLIAAIACAPAPTAASAGTSIRSILGVIFAMTGR